MASHQAGDKLSDAMRQRIGKMASAHHNAASPRGGVPHHSRKPPLSSPLRPPSSVSTPTLRSGLDFPHRTAANVAAPEETNSDGEQPTKTATDADPLTGGAALKKRRRDAGSTDPQQQPTAVVGTIPNVTLDELGGLQRELPIIRELVELPLRYPHLFSRIGADPPCGVLLHGPPGCGKTILAQAIAGSLKVPMFFVSAPEIVQGISGDSEAKLRTLFQDAAMAAPSIVFIDEIDTIAGRRENAQREMEKRIVAQLLSCMDQLTQSWRESGKVVCVIGATNRPEAIDAGLRRAGRFDREIALGIPTLDERKSILEVLAKRLTVAPDVDFFDVANSTPGYVGADLHLLIKEACILAIRRMHDTLSRSGELDNPQAAALTSFAVHAMDLKLATKRVQPSAMREGFSTIPNVTWADVGALEEARQELMTCVLQPIRTPRLHRRFGLDHPMCILLYGPPGCGKTLVAKAIASESGANFISIKGPELLNKFVGESERSVRMVFARGRASAPCVLFFDELDALAPRRGSDRANPSSERVVNQLLTEMDGVDGREHVYVIAATNRPDMIDPAMLRPGRLDKLLYVPLPTAPQRVAILRTVGRKYPLHESVDLEALGRDSRLEGFSGADLTSLVREASLTALKNVYAASTPQQMAAYERALPAPMSEGMPAPMRAGGIPGADELVPISDGTEVAMDAPSVTADHFKLALEKVYPSVSVEDRQGYDKLYQ